MTILNPGEWYQGHFFEAGGQQYFKFSVPYDPAMPCPSITLDLQIEFGEITIYAASHYIPTLSEFQWSHIFTAISSIAICPSHPAFVYGDYYVLLASGDILSNIFSLRYTLEPSPSCLNLNVDYSQVEIVSEPADMMTPIWLEDGVAAELTWPFNSSDPSQIQLYYALYAPSRCSSFNVAIYPATFYDTWLMIFGSNTNANPNYFLSPGSSQWQNIQTGMSKIDIYMCNPDSSKNYSVLYIGLYPSNVYPTANATYQLIGTTQRYSPSLALSSLGYTQSTNDLQYGALPALSCDNGYYTCLYPGGGECPVLHLPCCFPFVPVPPEENIQALWPINFEDVTSGSFYLPINFTTITPLVPGKLAFSLRLEDIVGTDRIVLAAKPTTCTLVIGDSLVDKNGVPLASSIGNITFTPTPLQCNYDSFKVVSDTIATLKENYLEAQTIPEVALNQLTIAIASWNDAYMGCFSYIQDELTTATPEYDATPAYLCTHTPNTLEYENDACCNLNLLPYLSCHPTMINNTLPISGTYLSSTAIAECKNPQCSESTIQTWIQQQQYMADPGTGCSANLFAQASHTRMVELLSFITTCKVQIEGDQLLGAPCSTSLDCYNHVACLPDTRTCNNTNQDILECLAKNVNRDIAISLFNNWNISEDPTVPLLMQAFADNWIQPLCVGPKSQDFRSGFKSFLISPSCVDTCVLQGIETYCPVTMWNTDQAICPSLAVCNVNNLNANVGCYRNWRQTYNAPQACIESLTCNWRQEGYWPCLPDSTQDCSSLCVNSSISAYACLDCSRNALGSCMEVTSLTNETRCGQGLCSAGLEITDAVACSNSGNCSVACPTCDAQPGCEAAGMCSDELEFGGVSGACIYPGIWTGSAFSCAYFPSDMPFYGSTLTSIGCAAFSISQDLCENLTVTIPGTFWYTVATDNASCLSNAGYGCYDPNWSTLFVQRPKSECDRCDSCTWQPVYSYSAGVWTPGTMQNLLWKPRSYGRQNTVSPAVDYTLIMNDVATAITKAVAHAYYTEALCRYENVDDLVNSIVCDCNSTSTQCFANTGASPIGSFRVCPYQSVSFGTIDASVVVQNDSVPNTLPCQQISIATSSVGKYQVPPDFSVTNQLFKQIQSNPYWIVENNAQAIVGQLISNAVQLTIPYTSGSDVTLCVLTEPFIQISGDSNLITLAHLQSDSSIKVYDRANSFSVSASDLNNGSRLSVCGPVSESGTWIAVAVVPDYASVDPSSSAQTITAFCFYIVVIALALFQGILIIAERDIVQLFAFKLAALFIIALNGAARAVYILPPANAFVGTNIESIAFTIYELPTFLYFSVFTVIMYLWTMVIVNTRRFERGSFAGSSRAFLRCFLAVNLFMYFIFVVFIFLTAILPANTHPSPCFFGNLDSTSSTIERSIKVGYWIFQCVVSVLLCIGFLVTAALLLKMIPSQRRNGLDVNQKKVHSGTKGDVLTFQLLIISSLAFVCIVFLLVRCIIFLVTVLNNGSIQVMTFCMLEIIPQLMLLLYIRPPTFFKAVITRATVATGRSVPRVTTEYNPTTAAGSSLSGVSTYTTTSATTDPDIASYNL